MDAADKLIPVKDAIRHFGAAEGHGPSVQSVKRWMSHGVRGVRLRGTLVGGRWRLSKSAIDEFLAEINGAVGGSPVAVSSAGERSKSWLLEARGGSDASNSSRRAVSRVRSKAPRRSGAVCREVLPRDEANDR